MSDYKFTLLEEVQHLIYKLKSGFKDIKAGFSNLWKWKKVIWKNRDWDFYYLYEMLEFKLIMMADTFEKNNIVEKTPEMVAEIRKVVRWIQLVKSEFEDIGYGDMHWGNVICKDLSDFITRQEYKQWLLDNNITPVGNNFETQLMRSAAIDKYNKLIFDKIKDNISNWWD